MKICRFDNNRLGLVEGSGESILVRDVTAALDVLPDYRYPLPAFDPLIANLPLVMDAIRRIAPGAHAFPLSQIKLLSPIANPGKIIAAPVNYAKHLDEAREQVEINFSNRIAAIQEVGLFLKATSSLIGAGDGVKIKHLNRRNDHEAELVVVIGKAGRDIPRAQALQHVAGYAVGLDMTTRGPEERSLRKSIDSYSVVGPWLVTVDEVADPSGIDFCLAVNGELRQQANTRDLIIDVPGLIEFASSFYTLHPGDILFTGTPEGVGAVLPGDRIVCSFNGIGTVAVQVHEAR